MSSKKSSRSKKTDGSNVPNFVFKIGGDAPTTPTFGFSSGGSQPGSPLASPGGAFGSNPGSPVASSAFTFNGPSTPTAASANAPFTFGSPNISSPTLFDTKRGVSDLTSLTTPESNTLRRTNSEISFGTSSSNNNIAFGVSPSSPSAGGGFSFNNNSSNNSAPTVSFGTSPAKQPTTLTSAFTFGAPATSTTTTPSSAASATTASASPAKTAPTLSSSFSFGSTSNDKPAASSFGGFGSSSTEKSTSSNTSTTSASAPFSINGSSSNPSAFTFGKPAATSANPAATSTTTNIAIPLASNATAKTAAITTSSPFTFGSPSATAGSSITATTTLTSKATADKATVPTFTFGAPSATKPATTSSSSTPSTTFSFGSPTTSSSSSTPTTPATSAAANASTTIAPSASLFSLGTVGDKDKDKEKEKDKKPAPFTFGSTPSLSTTPTATATNTTAAATVDLAKPNIYAFDKILDDMAKALAQPPTTMYASLIKPQQQFTTNFRIDNISRSTRFIELPEEAQKELDELEKYIRLEAQRSDYITNQKLPHHLSCMEQAQKDILQLSQHLDALSSTLKGQMGSIEADYESVKTQLRHANEGCAVLEACKHPGNNARWLFGYSEDDDYFSLLAKQLTNRLEEYKKCIWEIERTTESWKHNRVQSPQEIADIMRTQNEAFLALSNKVAALHDSVQNELNNYHQYLQMYA